MRHFWLNFILVLAASILRCDAYPASKLVDAYAQMIGYAPERTKFSRQFVGPIATVAGEPVRCLLSLAPSSRSGCPIPKFKNSSIPNMTDKKEVMRGVCDQAMW